MAEPVDAQGHRRYGPQTLSEYVALRAEVERMNTCSASGRVRYLAQLLLRAMPTAEEAGRWFEQEENRHA